MLRVRMASVIEAVCREYGVSRDEIMSRCRDPRVTLSRNLTMWLAVNRCLKSADDTGALMANRTRQTIHDGIKVIDANIEKSEHFHGKVEHIWDNAVHLERIYVAKWRTRITILNGTIYKAPTLEEDPIESRTEQEQAE